METITLKSFSDLPGTVITSAEPKLPKHSQQGKIDARPFLVDNRNFVDERMATPRVNNTHAPSKLGLSPFISKDKNFRRYQGEVVTVKANAKGEKKAVKSIRPKKKVTKPKPVFIW